MSPADTRTFANETFLQNDELTRTGRHCSNISSQTRQRDSSFYANTFSYVSETPHMEMTSTCRFFVTHTLIGF